MSLLIQTVDFDYLNETNEILRKIQRAHHNYILLPNEPNKIIYLRHKQRLDKLLVGSEKVLETRHIINFLNGIIS